MRTSHFKRLLAIDPGNEESGAVIVDTETLRPIDSAKIANEQLEAFMICRTDLYDEAIIEMVASYGMPVGETVFETCVAIGRFEQILDVNGIDHDRMFRREVKRQLCGSVTAKDANVTAALVDKFAPGEPNRGKGTKASPGWFYGFRADIWQAYALAVAYMEKERGWIPKTPERREDI